MREMNLPEGWKWVRLGEVIEESKELNTKNKIDIVFTISNKYGFVIQEEYFNRRLSSKDTRKYKIVKPDFFAYNPARINVGSISINKRNLIGIISPMYVVFKTKENLYPKYLNYHIQRETFRNQVIANTAGSVRESLNFSSLSKFDFMLPPFPEQKKIAEILETVDKIIEKTEKIIEKYKRIKQGLMQELFTKGIDENGKIRDEKTHRFKDSPIGRIPEEWEVVRLGDILKYEQPYKYIVKDTNYTKTGIPVLTAGKSFILGYTQESEGVYQNLPVIIFDDFTTDNKFVDFPFKVKSSAMKFLRPKNENINLRFVYETMQTLKYDYVSGDHKRRWISEFQHFLIPLPPLPEQERIAQTLLQIDKVIESEQKYKQKLESLKRGLMEDLLTGRVRVNLLE